MSTTNIEWTERVWNPTVGCSKVSPGCRDCYALRMAWRHIHNPKIKSKYAGTVEMVGNKPAWTGQINLLEDMLQQPLSVKKGTVWFVDSMSDLFHEKIPFSYITRVFEVMEQTPHHTYQILTKRPHIAVLYFEVTKQKQLPNVWIGASVEDGIRQAQRIGHLLLIPAAIRFLSCEPLLGPLDLNLHLKSGKLHWVIAGGESGHTARPMHPLWPQDLYRQCRQAGVPFFFKQWGEWLPEGQTTLATIPAQKLPIHHWPNSNTVSIKIGKKAAGCLLNGKIVQEFPAQQKL